MALIMLIGYLVTVCTATTSLSRGQNVKHPVPTPVDGLNIIRELEGRSTLPRNREDNVRIWENKQFKCQMLSVVYRNAKIRYPTLRNVLSTNLMEMLKNCSSRDMRLDDISNQPFIFPGTNWCGAGNVAENYHDLGLFNETDACCRKHDYCDDIIRPGRTKHNLINPYGTTRLHCKCDEMLRQCFRKVGSVVSNTIGWIFFSLLQTQCYDLNHPTTGCLLWRRGAVRMYCVKYKLEEEHPKKWQWFDQEPFF